ncbi:transcription factor TFIIIB component B'' [Bombyx mandarina]|uniref:Transcription factor TFIIIB component B'' n=1 Tax=Bombyx mandarina TaxID=7092 RepID=A0A6J2JHQ1_BOMMA|nr:transcription factor TFIIIB component B'' [Bombyx mandarina]
MSTRRARIKAVAALPPRRKNAENSENKNQQGPSTNDLQNVPKSPNATKHDNVAKTYQRASVANSPSKSPHSSVITQNTDRQPHVNRAATPVNKGNITPKLSDRVSVITSTAGVKSGVFASPHAKSSPLRKYIPSPVLAAMNTAEVTNKAVTPEKSDAKKNSDSTKSSGNNSTEIIQKISDSESSTSKSGTNTHRSDIPDDYSVPSVPESITEDPMDGIVPLQPVSAPKPIALLKNEIISENVEVLFDPIVPLPSPSKVRPKLRPVPRLGPLRRNSVQGSASESEDESRRSLLGHRSATPLPMRQRHDSHTTQHSNLNQDTNRTRNDSICSVVSQPTTANPALSPTKEKHYQTKTRRQEMSRRMAAMRRRRETAQRDTMTMYDLIFHNPSTNPMIPDQDEIKAQEANKASQNQPDESENDDPNDPPSTGAAPVPQIKLGPNGEIILDEQSLVIKQSNNGRKVSSEVREGAWNERSSGYRRSARTADWTHDETVRFYRALAAIGTDFTLMEPLFPGRTRRDLKLKFKKEEKLNIAQVDKALRSRVEWDAMGLHEEFKEERAEAAKREEEAKQRLEKQKKERQERNKELRGYRQSMSKKLLESSVLRCDLSNVDHTADDIIARASEFKSQKKRRPKKSIGQKPKPEPGPGSTSSLATLSVRNNRKTQESKNSVSDMAVITKIDPKPANMLLDNISNPSMPSNIETGSLVVLTVNDPNSPTKKMLQTYIAREKGKLLPVDLPPSLLNSVVGYVRKETTDSNASMVSSPMTSASPNSVASMDSRISVTPLQVNPSPNKRQRKNSYTITPL